MSSYDDRSGRAHPYDPDPSTTPNYSDTTVLDRDRDPYADVDSTYPATTGDGTVVERPRPAWNSGADLGLLLMRVVLGGIFIAHGGQKVFGWFGGPGLDGFAEDLAGMGFTQTDVLAAVTGFTELVGGSLVVLGLFTPLAAAGLLGVMVNAVWVKWNAGLFAADGGFELELALGAMAAALVLAGPGRAALDNGRAWFRHPVVSGLLCLVIGVAAALAIRLFFLA
ncbi:MAG TPA: DoxX family protein [Pseudonocardiaceae bacterium]